ncbi:5'-nucleotidase C-terminal domain-containing protein, partial [Klebsiella pneumoniae]|uniref:5'-nucleotidase C-terminal domain-containing protein n=1 Tax=Klebsiella pneumoniae TaxID=573 RepID=UPI00259FEDCE
MANLYAEYGQKKWADKQIVLGGGYISIRSPYKLELGDVTYADLVTLFPFDNKIQLCTIKGSDLLSKFINSTNENYFIGYTAYGI